MRTNIDIDDVLMAEAMAALGSKTKRETVEKALEDAVRRARQREIIKYRGKIAWEGDLEAMRLD